MAHHSEHEDTVKSGASISARSRSSEDTPLLRKESQVESTLASLRSSKTAVYKILFTSFLMALSFGVTQVPLIYIFGIFTCEEYYKSHPDPGDVPGRCRLSVIEGSTARALALLGAGTTFFGVANLFFVGWFIKRFGIKPALVTSCFWPALRLCIQNVGVEMGAYAGIVIIMCSQIITIFGGPAGYLLALNSYAAEVVTPTERTSTLGRLQGVSFFGTSLGYLAGGMLSDIFGRIAPFRVTLVLFCISTLYVSTCLPSLPNNLTPEQVKKTASLSAFFEPLKMFVPRKWVLVDGRVRRQYGITLLGAGAFIAILATGYIPVLLQMYAIDVLDFSTTEDGWLISINSLVRGFFLTFAFPAIIARGRDWLDKRQHTPQEDKIPAGEAAGIPEIPTDPNEFQSGAMEGEQEPEEPSPPHQKEESFHFDLIYARCSILADGILTCLAVFATAPWQLYLVATILPLSAGTGTSAKGTILHMCGPSERADALSAISLVEMVSKLATTGVFGYIFSAFAQIGRPNLTFLVNGAIAILAFGVFVATKFPPRAARRLLKDEDEEESGVAERG